MNFFDEFHMEVSKQRLLAMYVITFNPSDAPGKYVVRAWIGGGQDHGPTKLHIVCFSLDEARAYIPQGLVCWPRQDNDEPVIVETWF